MQAFLDKAVEQTVDVFTHYPGPIMIACAIVGTGLVYYHVLRWMESRKPSSNEEEMKRRAKLDEMYAERFGDVLFNAYIKGEITGKEYRRDCRKFNIAYRFPFTLTFRNKTRMMRAKVKKNCAEMHRTPSMSEPTRKGEPKLIGPKPGADMKFVAIPIKHVTPRKVWVVQANKLRRKSA